MACDREGGALCAKSLKNKRHGREERGSRKVNETRLEGMCIVTIYDQCKYM